MRQQYAQIKSANQQRNHNNVPLPTLRQKSGVKLKRQSATPYSIYLNLNKNNNFNFNTNNPKTNNSRKKLFSGIPYLNHYIKSNNYNYWNNHNSNNNHKLIRDIGTANPKLATKLINANQNIYYENKINFNKSLPKTNQKNHREWMASKPGNNIYVLGRSLLHSDGIGDASNNLDTRKWTKPNTPTMNIVGSRDKGKFQSIIGLNEYLGGGNIIGNGSVLHNNKTIKSGSIVCVRAGEYNNNNNIKNSNEKQSLTLEHNSSGNRKELNKMFNTKSKSHSVKEYSYTEEPNLSHRKGMEDYHRIIDPFNKDDSKGFFAIFDGHGGAETAKYCRETFHSFLSKSLNTSPTTRDALIDSFHSIDNEIGAKASSPNVGTTATIVFIQKETIKDNSQRRVIYCANVGDSKCYLVTKSGTCEQLSTDHKCTDQSEVDRIRANGGIVFGGRVYGTLMLTRTWGDKEMKKYGVLSTPSVNEREIKENDLYIVLASDGLWDVLDEDKLVSECREDLGAAEWSRKLVKIAMENDTRDNVSCIVIKL